MIEIVLYGFIGLPACFATPIDDANALLHAVAEMNVSTDTDRKQTVRFTMAGVPKGVAVAYICSGTSIDKEHAEQRGIAIAE